MTAAEEQEAPREVSPGPGERLRAAREAQGRSFDDVVHELRLDVRVVSAIEADDLDGLGAPVFVKGYLRSYARLVGLPEQEIVDAWQPGEQDPEEFRTVSMQREVKMGASLPMFVLWSLLALLVLGATAYLLTGNGDDAEPAATSGDVSEQTGRVEPVLREDFVVEDAPASNPPEGTATEGSGAVAGAAALAVVDSDVDSDVDSGVVGSGDRVRAAADAPADAEDAGAVAAGEEPALQQNSQQVAATRAVAEEPLAVARDALASGEVDLLVSFTAECWIELSASGRRLLYGLEKPGRERRFSARPPFRFFVGDADAVNIRVGGRDYVIPRSVRTGRNTARFVLDATDIEGLQ